MNKKEGERCIIKPLQRIKKDVLTVEINMGILLTELSDEIIKLRKELKKAKSLNKPNPQ